VRTASLLGENRFLEVVIVSVVPMSPDAASLGQVFFLAFNLNQIFPLVVHERFASLPSLRLEVGHFRLEWTGVRLFFLDD